MYSRKKHYHIIRESEKPNERESVYGFIPLFLLSKRMNSSYPRPQNQPKAKQRKTLLYLAHIDFIPKKTIHIRKKQDTGGYEENKTWSILSIRALVFYGPQLHPTRAM